jgi:hypothetical protein
VSGGSWDYAYGRINDIVDALRNQTTTGGRKLELNDHQIEQRQKLSDLMEKVSAALRAIEWVDSFDSSYPRDTKAVEEVFASQGRIPKIELRHDDKGLLDEVVAREATLHMEDMGSSWSILIDAGADHLNLSIGGRLKRPLVVEQSGSVISSHPKR